MSEVNNNVIDDIEANNEINISPGPNHRSIK